MPRDVDRLSRLITFLPYNLVEDVVVHGRALEPSLRWEEGCLLSAELNVVPARLERQEQAAAAEEVARAGADLGLALRRILEQCVFPRGGYLLKFSANGVLVMFTRRVPGQGPQPWSSSDENVAAPEQRAARCGLELLQILRDVLPNAFTLRAGLETGRFRMALCGQPGHRLEQLAFGSLCARVARLRDSAGPGELVVGPDMIKALTGWQPHVGPIRGEGRRLMNVPVDVAGPASRIADLSPLYTQRPRFYLDRLRVLLPEKLRERAELEDPASAGVEVRPVTTAVIPLDVDHPDSMDDAEVMLDLNAGVMSLIETVEQNGGVVLRLDVLAGGSAALAAFGFGETPRRASRAAVTAALQLSHRFGQESTRWVVRAAVETGRAYVGEVGSPLKRELTVVGGPAVVAIDLAAHAIRGQVLVGETAWRLSGSAVAGRSIGQLAVGQPPRSWPVYEALSLRIPGAPVSQAPSRDNSSDDNRGESERVRLRSRLVRMLHEAQRVGRGSAVVIYGGDGAGKSELVGSLADVAAELGFKGSVVRCPRDLSQAPPSPLAQLLGDVLGISRQASPRERAEKVHQELTPLLPAGQQLPRSLWQMFAAPAPVEALPSLAASLPADVIGIVVDWLRARAQQTPLWLAVEDVHHADEQTLAALALLMKAIPQLPIVALVTATHDPEQNGPVMPQRTISTLHRSGARWFALPPLNTPEAMQLLARELNVPDATDMGVELSGLLSGLERAGGQARAVRDMAHLVKMHLAEGRSIFEAWADASEALSSRDLWQLKLDGLAAELRTLVRLAGVLGFEFETAVLWRSLQAGGGGGSLGELVAKLGRLTEHGVLVPALVGGQVGYRFSSAALRDVAYETWTPPMRARWHGHAAQALLAVTSPDGNTVPGRVAHHLRLSAQPTRALPHLISAAQQMKQLGHLREAAGLLEQALALARRAPEERRRAELELGRLLLALGQGPLADNAASGLTDDAAAPAELRAQAWGVRAQAALLSDDDVAAASAARAGRRLTSRTEQAALRLSLSAIHVEELWRRGEPEQSVLYYEQVNASIASTVNRDEPAFMTAAVELETAVAGALHSLGRTDEGVRRLESVAQRSLALHQTRCWGALHARLGDCTLLSSPDTSAWALSTAVDVLEVSGDLHAAMEARLQLVRALLRSARTETVPRILDALWVRAHLLTGPRATLLNIVEAQHRALEDARGTRTVLERIRPDIPASPPRWRSLLWMELARTAELAKDTVRAGAWRQQAKEAAVHARAGDLARAVDHDITLRSS